MPILWRYLLRNYFQVFFLCVSAFISVLLVLRFQEIARFITSEASFAKVVLFSLYQIPYILPIAIPISCLISSLLLFQKLSHYQEITALRTIGLSLQKIVIPILASGFLLVLFNAMIAFELAPICRSKARMLIYETVTSNPLFTRVDESIVIFFPIDQFGCFNASDTFIFSKSFLLLPLKVPPLAVIIIF